MASPKISYLVCASQRSGTELLCRALTDTGVAGQPQEYFLAEDPVKMPDWRFWEEGPVGVAHGVTDRESYLELVYRLGTTGNGVFGAKLQWNNLRWAIAKFAEMPRFAGLDRAAILHSAFPNLHVINVTRRDRARQAVSWARSALDGVWVLPADEPTPPSQAPPEYHFELIATLERLIAEGEAGWRQLYNELGVTPCEVVYEDLASGTGYEPTIRRVLAHLGLDETDRSIPPPRTRRQANELNDEWLARYRAELNTSR